VLLLVRINRIVTASMTLDNLSLQLMQNLKYLRVNFSDNCAVEVDCSAIKRKFYSACNSVFQRCGCVSEIVRLQLVKSLCLHLLYWCCNLI